jgi:hypothetical protein
VRVSVPFHAPRRSIYRTPGTPALASGAAIYQRLFCDRSRAVRLEKHSSHLRNQVPSGDIWLPVPSYFYDPIFTTTVLRGACHSFRRPVGATRAAIVPSAGDIPEIANFGLSATRALPPSWGGGAVALHREIKMNRTNVLVRFKVNRRKRGLGCCNRQPRGRIGYAT